MFTLIHPWAVLVAAIAAYLVGWAWYSPILWQKPWMAARGATAEDSKAGMKEMPKVMFYGFLNTLAEVFAIAVFLALIGPTTLVGSLQVALLLCFGFVVTVKFNDLLYTAHPPHWGRRAQMLFLIDAGYQVALFVVAAAIIWYMH
jgi:hypothetical protein